VASVTVARLARASIEDTYQQSTSEGAVRGSFWLGLFACEECPAVPSLRGIMSNLKDWGGNVKP
jgi:hypothetical protein